LNKRGLTDKHQYLLSLRGRIAFVLQTVPNDQEFIEYQKLFQNSLVKI